jgi:hypothetical protein
MSSGSAAHSHESHFKHGLWPGHLSGDEFLNDVCMRTQGKLLGALMIYDDSSWQWRHLWGSGVNQTSAARCCSLLGKAIFLHGLGTSLAHFWKLGIYWVPGHGAAADIDGIQIWAKGRAGPGIDRGMFLRALKGWRCAQTIINRFFTPCNNSMTYDGPRRLAPERAKLWPESSLQRHVTRSTDLKVTLVPSPRSGS